MLTCGDRLQTLTFLLELAINSHQVEMVGIDRPQTRKWLKLSDTEGVGWLLNSGRQTTDSGDYWITYNLITYNYLQYFLATSFPCLWMMPLNSILTSPYLKFNNLSSRSLLEIVVKCLFIFYFMSSLQWAHIYRLMWRWVSLSCYWSCYIAIGFDCWIIWGLYMGLCVSWLANWIDLYST